MLKTSIPARVCTAALAALALLAATQVNAGTTPKGTGVYKVLASFSQETGYDARGPLTLGADGNFYGVTTYGGAHSLGAVFRVTPKGKMTVLHQFTGAEGGLPIGSLLLNPDGSFMGTTCDGGPYASGVVYRISTLGELQVVHEFGGQRQAPGEIPKAPACSYAPLLRAQDGLLYGTTNGGGKHGAGTVFAMSEDGSTFRVLHDFRGGAADGGSPTAGLIQASDGAFYGTTTLGGPSDMGAVFKITAGAKYKVLHFMEQAGGNAPFAPLMQATDGALYGVNQAYGPDPWDTESGTVYRITTDGQFSLAWAFGELTGDPRMSSAGLLQTRDGSLWGSSSWGGATMHGSIFRITASGDKQVIHSFTDADGSSPAGGLIYGRDGKLYGTTSTGGANGLGVVYRIDPK